MRVGGFGQRVEHESNGCCQFQHISCLITFGAGRPKVEIWPYFEHEIIELDNYSSLKIHFPPLRFASSHRACTACFVCSFAFTLSSSCSCVVGKSTRQ